MRIAPPVQLPCDELSFREFEPCLAYLASRLGGGIYAMSLCRHETAVRVLTTKNKTLDYALVPSHSRSWLALTSGMNPTMLQLHGGSAPPM